MIGIPKPSPYLLKQQKARAERDKVDREERAKVRARSGGRCEMRMPGSFGLYRCHRHAAENHHLISGIGRRNRGRSLKAEHRLDLCRDCHKDITNHVLVPTDWTTREYAATVTYERKVLQEEAL